MVLMKKQQNILCSENLADKLVQMVSVVSLNHMKQHHGRGGGHLSLWSWTIRAVNSLLFEEMHTLFLKPKIKDKNAIELCFWDVTARRLFRILALPRLHGLLFIPAFEFRICHFYFWLVTTEGEAVGFANC